MNQWKKEKRNSVPVTRSFLCLFLSHRHAVLSRATQHNCQNLAECSKTLQII
jgi:hypothetical protein